MSTKATDAIVLQNLSLFLTTVLQNYSTYSTGLPVHPCHSAVVAVVEGVERDHTVKVACQNSDKTAKKQSKDQLTVTSVK